MTYSINLLLKAIGYRATLNGFKPGVGWRTDEG